MSLTGVTAGIVSRWHKKDDELLWESLRGVGEMISSLVSDVGRGFVGVTNGTEGEGTRSTKASGEGEASRPNRLRST